MDIFHAFWSEGGIIQELCPCCNWPLSHLSGHCRLITLLGASTQWSTFILYTLTVAILFHVKVVPSSSRYLHVWNLHLQSSGMCYCDSQQFSSCFFKFRYPCACGRFLTVYSVLGFLAIKWSHVKYSQIEDDRRAWVWHYLWTKELNNEPCVMQNVF